MNCQDVRDRLDQYQAAELGQWTARRLESHLHQCRGCYQELRQVRESHALLEDLGQHLRPVRSLSHSVLASIEDLPVPRPEVVLTQASAPRRLRWVLVGAAAAAVIAVVLFNVLRRQEDVTSQLVGAISRVEGQVRVLSVISGEWARLEAGRSIRIGDEIEIVDDSTVALGEEGEWQARFRGPGRCQMGRGESARQLDLQSGWLEISEEPTWEDWESDPLIVRTPRGEARALRQGSRFTVEVGDEAGDVVEVLRGEVGVTAASVARQVAASGRVRLGTQGIDVIAAAVEVDRPAEDDDSSGPASVVTGGRPVKGMIETALERPLDELMPPSGALAEYLRETSALLNECDRLSRDAHLLAVSQVPETRVLLLEDFARCLSLRFSALAAWGIEPVDLTLYRGLEPKREDHPRSDELERRVATLWAAREKVASSESRRFQRSIMNAFVSDVLVHAREARFLLRGLLEKEKLGLTETTDHLRYHAFGDALEGFHLALVQDEYAKGFKGATQRLPHDPLGMALLYRMGWATAETVEQMRRRDSSDDRDVFWRAISGAVERGPRQIARIIESPTPPEKGGDAALAWAFMTVMLEFVPGPGLEFEARKAPRWVFSRIRWLQLLKSKSYSRPPDRPPIAWIAGRFGEVVESDLAAEVVLANRRGLLQSGTPSLKETLGRDLDLARLRWSDTDFANAGAALEALRLEALSRMGMGQGLKDVASAVTQLEAAIDRNLDDKGIARALHEVVDLSQAVESYFSYPEIVRFGWIW